LQTAQTSDDSARSWPLRLNRVSSSPYDVFYNLAVGSRHLVSVQHQYLIYFVPNLHVRAKFLPFPFLLRFTLTFLHCVALHVENKTNIRLRHGISFCHMSSAIALRHAACYRHAIDQRYILYDGNPSFEKSNRIACRTRYRRNKHFMISCSFWRGSITRLKEPYHFRLFERLRDKKISDLQQTQRTHCLLRVETKHQRTLANSRTDLKISPALLKYF